VGFKRKRITGHRLHERCRRLLREKDEEIFKLRARVEQLEIKVEKLIALLKQNSKNSSRPPSSDRYRSKEKQAPSERKVGGQPDHPGHFRALIPSKDVDERIVLKPTQCESCGQALSGEDEDPLRHQVTDFPPIKPKVSEYQLHRLVCPGCGKKTQATLPAEVPTGAFGPQITAVASIARSVYRMSKEITRSMLADLFGVTISNGSLSALEKATSQRLAMAVEEALAYVQAQKKAHSDETGWSQHGNPAWLWAVVTDLVSVFKIQEKRDTPAMKNILGDFDGILNSDRYGTYGEFAPSKRQVCWAHLLRDFAAMLDRGKSAKALAEKLIVAAHAMFHKWHALKDGKTTRAFFQKEMERIQEVMLGLLEDGSLCVDDKTARVCRNLLKLKEALFTFVHVEGIEPTNNAAERALRPAVIWRKNCYGTQSETGSRFAERMLTVSATLKQQGRNIVDFVVQTCRATLEGQPAPSLLPLAVQRE
jgi:transposase